MNSKDKKSKRKSVIIAAIIALILLIIFGIYKFVKSRTIYLNDYIVIKTNGFDEIGTCEVSIDWGSIRKQYSDAIDYKRKYKKEEDSKYNKALSEIITSTVIEIDKSNKLTNGDIINYQINIDGDIKERINHKIKYTNGSFKIKGLKEATVIDFFKPFNEPYIKLSGINGDTTAELNAEFAEGEEIFNDGTLVAKIKEHDFDHYAYCIDVYIDNELFNIVTYDINYSDSPFMKNGDIVTLSLYGTDGLLRYGYKPKENNLVFVVEDRPELLTDLTIVKREDIEKCLLNAISDHDVKLNLDDYKYSYNYTDIGDYESKTGYKKDYFDNVAINIIYKATPKNIDSNLNEYFFAEYTYTRHYDTDYRYNKYYNRLYDIVKFDQTHTGIAELKEIYFDNGELLPHGGSYAVILDDYFGDSSIGISNINDYIDSISSDYNIEKMN